MSLLSKEDIRTMIKENNITTVEDIHTVLKNMFKDVLQEMLEAELDDNLGYTKYDTQAKATDNSRNGYSKRTVGSELGALDLNIPRDRNGEFEPKVVPKHKRDVSGIEEKVISLYASGMSSRDIHEQIKGIYGVEVSADIVSNITDRIMPQILEW